MAQTIVTVTGFTYFQPILDLAERLLQRERRKVVAGRVGERENGYSLSIVLLLVVSLESYVGRVSYLQRRDPKGKVKPPRTTVPDYLATLRKSFGLQKSLTEVFVLRDVIAHGHVWELTVSDHAAHGQILRRADLLPGYGDYKYKVAINPSTRCTSINGLNLVPSAVGREEVFKVFNLVRRTYVRSNDVARHGPTTAGGGSAASVAVRSAPTFDVSGHRACIKFTDLLTSAHGVSDRVLPRACTRRG